MAPSNPKRPPHGPPPSAPSRKDEEIDLPFDTSEVTPLRVDDPRPQRVTQYPATARRASTKDAVPTEILRAPTGAELAARFGPVAEPEFRPVYLYVERGPGAGQLVPVRQGKLTIGRSSSSDLRLQHPSISRRHAVLTRQEERFFLRDLESQNGTFINRSRLSGEKELSPGDLIAVGTAVLKLRGPLGLGELAGPVPTHRSRALKVAVFACMVATGLAGIFLIALLRMHQRLDAPRTPPLATVPASRAPAAPSSPKTALHPTAPSAAASPSRAAPPLRIAPHHAAPPPRHPRALAHEKAAGHHRRPAHAAPSRARAKKKKPVSPHAKRRRKIRSAIDAAFGN